MRRNAVPPFLKAFSRYCACLLAFVSPVCIAAPATEEASIAATRRIATGIDGRSAASHELRLSLYVFQATRWSLAEMEAAALQAVRLLAQCAIASAAVELHILQGPPRFHFYSTAVSRALLRQLTVAKPAVFFVEGTDHRPAYDAEAIGRSNSANRPELADTVWIAHGAKDLPQVLAHELVHVLSDSGAHSDAPGNLMAADTSEDHTALSAAQCERVRSHGEANGLLKRIAKQ
jgi:hypothetical protein